MKLISLISQTPCLWAFLSDSSGSYLRFLTQKWAKTGLKHITFDVKVYYLWGVSILLLSRKYATFVSRTRCFCFSKK